MSQTPPISPGAQPPPSRPSDAPADDQRILLGWLRDRDVAGPLCKYNLRGLQSPRCPECGQELTLGVSLAEPFLAAWIALLAALLPPAGVGAIFLCVFINAMIRNGLGHLGMGNMPIGVAFLLFHILASIPLSVAAVLWRRRFMQCERSTQQRLAAAAWAADAMSLLVVLYQVNH